MRYRRALVQSASYFFTVNLADRSQSLLTDNIDLLRACVKKVKRRHEFTIAAMLVLPEHIHAVWILPEGDADYSVRWALIKASFSKALPIGEKISASRVKKGERGIWQRRFWEHQIKDQDDFNRHVDYIQINPVKHGYVQQCVDWPYSSFHRYVREGILPVNWAIDINGDVGWGE